MYFTEDEINGIGLNIGDDWDVDFGVCNVQVDGLSETGQRIFGTPFYDENGNDSEEYGDAWIDVYAYIKKGRRINTELGMHVEEEFYYVSKVDFYLVTNNASNEERCACFEGIGYEEGEKIFKRLNEQSKLNADDEGSLLRWVSKEYEGK